MEVYHVEGFKVGLNDDGSITVFGRRTGEPINAYLSYPVKHQIRERVLEQALGEERVHAEIPTPDGGEDIYARVNEHGSTRGERFPDGSKVGEDFIERFGSTITRVFRSKHYHTS